MKKVFELQLPALLYFVKESCHENLHHTLDELFDMTSETDLDDIPRNLTSLIKSFIGFVRLHLEQEEGHLFPMIENGQGPSSFSIDHLLYDHEEIKNNLLIIRKITHDFQFPLELSPVAEEFYEKLREMDRILFNHIQIENHILFPMVQKAP